MNILDFKKNNILNEYSGFWKKWISVLNKYSGFWKDVYLDWLARPLLRNLGFKANLTLVFFFFFLTPSSKIGTSMSGL